MWTTTINQIVFEIICTNCFTVLFSVLTGSVVLCSVNPEWNPRTENGKWAEFFLAIFCHNLHQLTHSAPLCCCCWIYGLSDFNLITCPVFLSESPCLHTCLRDAWAQTLVILPVLLTWVLPALTYLLDYWIIFWFSHPAVNCIGVCVCVCVCVCMRVCMCVCLLTLTSLHPPARWLSVPWLSSGPQWLLFTRTLLPFFYLLIPQ